MSFVTTNPEALALAAGNLHDVAFIPTQFSAHGALYQLAGARATGVHEQFYRGPGHQRQFLCGRRSRQHHFRQLTRRGQR